MRRSRPRAARAAAASPRRCDGQGQRHVEPCALSVLCRPWRRSCRAPVYSQPSRGCVAGSSWCWWQCCVKCYCLLLPLWFQLGRGSCGGRNSCQCYVTCYGLSAVTARLQGAQALCSHTPHGGGGAGATQRPHPRCVATCDSMLTLTTSTVVQGPRLLEHRQRLLNRYS